MRDLCFWFNVSARNASIEVNLAHECVFFATLCGKHLSLTKHPTYMQASIFNAGGTAARGCFYQTVWSGGPRYFVTLNEFS
jgi:hypothetical protein